MGTPHRAPRGAGYAWGAMKVLYDSLRGFARDERGGECLEYALVAGMITVVALSAIAAVGTKVKGYWQALDQALGV